MAQNEDILFELKFDGGDAVKRMTEIQQALVDLNKEYNKVTAEVKNQEHATAEQAQAMVDNRRAVKELREEMKFYEKQLQADVATQKKSELSINDMRKQLKALLVQYDELDGEMRKGQFGEAMRQQIEGLTDEIKQAEFATQRYGRNVGNYANSIKQALAGSVPAIGKFGDSIMGLKTSAGWIGLAIEAVVSIVMGLSKAFNRTEGNSDKLKGSMGKLKGLFTALQQAVEPLTKVIAEGFTKAIDSAVSALGWLSTKIQQFLRWVGADDLANKMQAFGVRAQEMAEATEDLAIAEEQLARKQREARKTMLEYQRQAEELRQTRDDATKSAEEQEEANRKLLALLQEQKKVEGGIQQEAIRIAKERIAIYGETTENLDALADAETEYADVIERITGQSSEALKWQNDRLAKYKEEAYIIDSILKKTLDVNNVSSQKPKRPTFEDEEEDEEIEDVSKNMIERNKMRLEYEKLGADERLKLQQENIAIEHAQRVASGEDALATEIWYQGEMTRIAKENADARKQYMEQLATSSLSATADMIGALEELAKESGASEEYMKKLAVAKIAINTATAIAQGVSGAMAVPFPANIPALLATITAVISGIAQAKSALSTANVPKYATGGLVQGAGTGTSDSIPAMLSNGESVMTARATSAYSPLLSALNTSVGGAPIGESTKIKGTQQLVQQFADVVEQIQIQVAVTDINDGQARVAKIVDDSNY